MTKRARQGTILRLIRDREINTQTELADALAEEGFEVTQTTVSRDLRELGLNKVRGANGHLVYAQGPDLDQLETLSRALQRWVLTMEPSGNMVVIRTPNGYADPVAQAIDESGHPEVLGTVAGENTVLVVAVEGVTGGKLADSLGSLAMGRVGA
jgi:transcriptional regulator of arginine metabolism